MQKKMITEFGDLLRSLHLCYCAHVPYSFSTTLTTVKYQVKQLVFIERFKSSSSLGYVQLRQTANGRNDHVTLFILRFPPVFFSSSVKWSSIALASKARISWHYSHLCTHSFKKT